MKKIYNILVVILVMTASSCGDNFLDAPTKSSLDPSIIFSTPDLARGAVDGIKVSFGETNSYRGRFLPYYGMNTDIEWYNNSHSPGDNSDLAVYNANSINSQMNTANNAYAKMYEGIERANLCIQGLREYGNTGPDTDLGYLLGEALTLRAIYYADLVKAWGDVPGRFEPVSSATIYVPRSNRDEIYKQLIADLEEAAELVPWPNESPNTMTTENINKAFVKAFRARLCLAASGYSQYTGGVRRSNDPELSVANMYAIARQECLDVINSGSAMLNPSFEGFWKSYNEENIAAGGESLWEIPFSDGRGRMLFTFAVRHTNNDQHHENGNNRGGVAGPLPHVFYDYDVLDTRRDVTCVPYLYGAATGPSDNRFAQQEIGNVDTWYFGKYRYEWMNRTVTSTNDDGVNKIYMRYAEVILMMAEIENELNGSAAAAPYLKEIRRRAFDPSDWAVKVDAYVDGISGYEDMKNKIIDEHGFEFCGEMERKQALIRWNLLTTKIDEAKAKMYNLRSQAGTGLGDYGNVPATLYYRYETDGETLDIYGLNRDETTDPGVGYTAHPYIDEDEIDDQKIESIYANNPDTRQYWPIWQVFIDASNGTLSNE